jgi:hypothetical protein
VPGVSRHISAAAGRFDSEDIRVEPHSAGNLTDMGTRRIFNEEQDMFRSTCSAQAVLPGGSHALRLAMPSGRRMARSHANAPWVKNQNALLPQNLNAAQRDEMREPTSGDKRRGKASGETPWQSAGDKPALIL